MKKKIGILITVFTLFLGVLIAANYYNVTDSSGAIYTGFASTTTDTTGQIALYGDNKSFLINYYGVQSSTTVTIDYDILYDPGNGTWTYFDNDAAEVSAATASGSYVIDLRPSSDTTKCIPNIIKLMRTVTVTGDSVTLYTKYSGW